MPLFQRVTGNAHVQSFLKRVMPLTVVAGVLLTAVVSAAGSNGLSQLTVSPNASGANFVQAKLLITAPPQQVWQSLTSYESWAGVLPGYEKCVMEPASGGKRFLNVTQKVAMFLPAYHFRLQILENPAAYSLRLNRISGDFKTLDATYKLISQRNGTQTMLLYTLKIDSGVTMPGTRNMVRNNTQRSLQALEQHIEAESRKSVIGQN